MTGAELKAIRIRLYGRGVFATVQFGRSVGYEGTDASVAMMVRRSETRATVPGPLARATEMLVRMEEGSIGVRSHGVR